MKEGEGGEIKGVGRTEKKGEGWEGGWGRREERGGLDAAPSKTNHTLYMFRVGASFDIHIQILH